MRAVVVTLALLFLPGCAEVAAECAGALLQATAQVCVDVICNDANDANDNHAGADDDAPREPREIPPPAWQPHEGGCDVTGRDGDHGGERDGRVRVNCADGTRAVFTSSLEVALVEREPGAGGCSVIRQGIDGDGDGALSPTEITGRVIDCPDRDGVRSATLEGHLAIFGPDDVARLAGRRALSGSLIVKSATLSHLDLPELQSVGGTVRVDGASALQSLTFAHLAAVGGDVVISRAVRLSSLRAPLLAAVGGSVVVVDNPSLMQSDVDEMVFRLSRHGFAGPVDLAGNKPFTPPPATPSQGAPAAGTAPPAP